MPPHRKCVVTGLSARAVTMTSLTSAVRGAGLTPPLRHASTASASCTRDFSPKRSSDKLQDRYGG